MTLQEYPTCGTLTSDPVTDVSVAVDRVAEFSYWQLLLGPATKADALAAVALLADRLRDQIEAIWPEPATAPQEAPGGPQAHPGWEVFCPFDQRPLADPDPLTGLSYCGTCLALVEPHVRAL